MIEDGIFFKVLAHNDTGVAAGHQGGIVIPKDLALFFPPVAGVVAATSPTQDVRLAADLYVDGVRLATVDTRYQHQTWGGKRSPERRLTDNLGPLRNRATAGDILLFRKNLDDDSVIELHLVSKISANFAHFAKLTSGRRWGALDETSPPVTQAELSAAEAALENEAKNSPSAFSSGRATVMSSTMLKARDRAFRRRVIKAYGGICAFTSRRFAIPERTLVGLDAAHIVPVGANGSDDPANGLPLTKDMHWAFDRGLISVDEKRCIFVPRSVSSIHGNEYLGSLHG